jgi:flagellar protein FliO/FliZ
MTAARCLVWVLAVAAAGAALPQDAYAGALGDGAAVVVSPWRVVGSLLLCLALGAAAIVLLRRHFGLGRGGPLRAANDRRMRVIEQHALGPHRSLSLIEIDARAYVALIAPGAATLVAVDAPPSPPAESPV